MIQRLQLKKELIAINESMKNGYIEHSLDCKEFLNELGNLYRYERLDQFQKSGDATNLLLYGKVEVKEKRLIQKHIEEYK